MQRLILTMGLPGSGKTFFSARLADALGYTHISSDRIRKQLLKRGMYTEADKHQVYLYMRDQAKQLLDAGRSVILDATFYCEETRHMFLSLCKRQRIPSFLILLYADETVIRERLENEREDSEADFEVYLKVRAIFEPFSTPFLVLHSGRESIQKMLKRTLSYINQRHEPATDKADTAKKGVPG